MRTILSGSIYATVLLLMAGSTVMAQDAQKDSVSNRVSDLQEVVVTGQYQPQSLRKSVYQVRTINADRIKAQAATNLTGVLNNELGIRFFNDRALGTTDIELMGMSGRNVKILLDGVPMVDRGDTRESLNQIDVHSIDRIEIVEGPMSVSYGSDALAGVINIITKKPGKSSLSVSAGMQEESAGGEYNPLLNKGMHNQYLNLGWQKNGWSIAAGGAHNDFGGWKESRDVELAKQEWHPKEQWLGNARLGYRNAAFNAWYRFDMLRETISNNGPIFEATNTTPDQNFFSRRFMHQVQAEYNFSHRLQLSGIAAYTDYSRRTQTTILDLNTGKRTLSLGEGEQDKAKFNSLVARVTAQYKVSEKLSFQPGFDFNRESASGARIQGTPSITDFAFFASGEWKPTEGINIRPGLRVIRNSVYDAPPVIPSINTKFDVGRDFDLRLAYARGFRSPALRELYFYFFDASHSIKGNTNLEAETSNSFNGSLTWHPVLKNDVKLKTSVGAFYNDFRNQINYGYDALNPDIMTYVNIDRFKTTGVTISSTVSYKAWQGTLGFSYIGRYNRFADDTTYSKNSTSPTFVWSPEVNANLSYNIRKIGTSVSVFYKFTGKRPVYQATVRDGKPVAALAETASFHWADATVSKSLGKFITLSAGVKNIFDVTTLNSTLGDAGSVHNSGGGSVPLSYGRSYFAGIAFQWNQ
ncbi:TonB-dependent receptor [Pseudoflavitalea sp. G-6-1-2]|uniref:TonB-dependent receptor plug domain-containing protein n=1 Tax=Pseudoflavitalea sp. G-6-1-2 TaxID=2728841 RepID=UPI00197E3DAF|nr:TonB-dependent receptor [Pseudoflavitalea sp. G-6-1-2]